MNIKKHINCIDGLTWTYKLLNDGIRRVYIHFCQVFYVLTCHILPNTTTYTGCIQLRARSQIHRIEHAQTALKFPAVYVAIYKRQQNLNNWRKFHIAINTNLEYKTYWTNSQLLLALNLYL